MLILFVVFLHNHPSLYMYIVHTLGEVHKHINTEEHHLRAIWRELGVGKTGYLTIKELSTVCQHIGMQDMDGDVRKNSDGFFWTSVDDFFMNSEKMVLFVIHTKF